MSPFYVIEDQEGLLALVVYNGDHTKLIYLNRSYADNPEDGLAGSNPGYQYIRSDMEATEAAVIQAGLKLKQVYPVGNEDKAEFIGQIIDGFEAFLDRKGIILSPEQEQDGSVKLAGADYEALKTFLTDTMKNWRVME